MTDSSHPKPIAVLDDDVQFIRMVERILKGEDTPIQPVTTPDLDEAVRVVAQTGCKAALVDIFMYGEAAGFEIVERLRAHPETRHLPLIVTSGAYQEIARRVPFLQQYHCLVLPKPFEIDSLLMRLREASDPTTFADNSPDGEPSTDDVWAPRRHGNWRFFANPLRRMERTV
jgi:CheY-like chemotaxis protein